MDSFGTANAKMVASTVVGCARWEVETAALMGAVAGRALEILREFNAQEVANTVWAFAKLEMKGEELMQSVASRAP